MHLFFLLGIFGLQIRTPILLKKDSFERNNHGMTVYVVEGEFLNSLNKILGARPIDKFILLPKQKGGPFDNHSMKSVLKALEPKEYE